MCRAYRCEYSSDGFIEFEFASTKCPCIETERRAGKTEVVVIIDEEPSHLRHGQLMRP